MLKFKRKFRRQRVKRQLPWKESDSWNLNFSQTPNTPDPAPWDYHVSRPLKEALRGQRFATDDEVKDVVFMWLRSASSSSSIGTTAHCGLWPVEQYPSIFPYLSPSLSIFSLPALEDLFLLSLSILSWVFHFSSLPVFGWRSFWAPYPPPFSPGDLTSLSFALISISLYFFPCSSLLVPDSSYFSILRFHILDRIFFKIFFFRRLGEFVHLSLWFSMHPHHMTLPDVASITIENFHGRWNQKACEPLHNIRCKYEAIILRNDTLCIGRRLLYTR